MNTFIDISRLILQSLFLAGVSWYSLCPQPSAAQTSSSSSPAITTFRWVEVPGKSFDLRYGDMPVVRYMCQPFDDSTPRRRDETYKPFHHVFSPDGSVQLTKGDPDGLYPHHRGLFYGFRVVTYGDGKKCDIWHCTDGTHQTAVRVISQHADGETAGHVVAIDWHGREKEVFAHERRGIEVRKKPGGLVIDFTSHLETADGQPIHLDGDPQHAGFHFRAAQEDITNNKEADQNKDKKSYFLRADGKGKEGETRNWDPNKQNDAASKDAINRPWLAMSFELHGKRYTVLYLDHPDNPKPARYSERAYGRFGSYFVTDVTKEKPLDVKYRVWVQEGEMTVDQCAAMQKEFTSAKL